MKILQICYAYPPSFSGYGKQLLTINNELVKKNSEIKISVLTAFDGSYHKLNKQKNITIFSFFDKERTFYKSTIIVSYLFSILVLFRFFKEFYTSDVVHVVKAGAEAAVAILLCKIFNKPVIVKVVQNDIVSKNDKSKIGLVTTLKNNIIILWATKIVAISQEIAKNLNTHNIDENRILRIPNSIDTNRFVPIKNKNRGSDYGLSFLYIGSITKRKGVDDLLHAIEKLDVNKNVKFLFVGPNYNEIENFHSRINIINESNNMKNVEYIPYTKTPEKILQKVDFLILPSYSEGMPNVVLESLSCEVPVILSDIPVHCELADDEYSRLYELGNISSLEKVLLDIIDEPDSLLVGRENGRKYVLKCNDVKLIAATYDKVYTELIHNV